MRKFYLVSSIVVGVMILVLAFAQLGASCQLILLPSDSVFLTFIQVGGLGAIFGGLLMLFWKMPPPEIEDEEDVVVTPEKPSTKIDE